MFLNTRRCVGMADEGDSKSLVLITRVGSTPTTGINESPESCVDAHGSGYFCCLQVMILQLMQKLFAQNRLADAKRATEDKAYRDELMKELKIG